MKNLAYSFNGGYTYNREKVGFLSERLFLRENQLEMQIGGEEAMFVEELTKIRESEARAEEIQKKAKLDSKQTIEAAESKAAKILEEAEARGREACNSLIREGQEIADEQYALTLEKTKEECKALIEKARNNEIKTVGFIAERIVRASVNN